MKNIKQTVIFMLGVFFFANSAQATAGFQELYKKNQKQSVKQQQQFFKTVGLLLQNLEKEKRKKSVAWELFLMNMAYAQSNSWCVNNGFIADVTNCNLSNNWSFSVTENPDFQLMQQAQIHFECAAGTQPCSLVAGISADGSGYCSPNSTRQCLSQGESGGVERLVNILRQCRGGSATVTMGIRSLNCASLQQSISQQLATLEAHCITALNQVRSLCEATRAKLTSITSSVAEEAPSASAVLTNGSRSALFIGDSHSYGCFGEAVQQGLEQQGLSVRASATCGSSASGWLAPTNSTTCGYRTCANGNCNKTTRGFSPGLQTLLNESQPGITVIALGSNMLKGNWNNTQRDVIALINQAKSAGSRCVWVGPPQASIRFMSVERYNTFVENLSATVTSNGCEFIDSSVITNRANTEGDSMGLHYGCNTARAWGNAVNSQLVSLLTPTATEGSPADLAPTSP